jgi:oligopeptide transport system substrate-binding protein
MLCRPKLPGRLGGGPNPLADVRVRQALAMAVDKRFIVKNLSRMGELPARTYLPPDGTLPKFTWMPGPNDVEHKGRPYTYKEIQARLESSDGLTGEGPGLPYDPQRARQLLAEAGYPDGQGFPRLPLSYNTDSPLRRDICQALQNQWKKVLNVDVFIDPQEGKIYKRVISAKDYAIGLAAWFGDYPDVSTFTDKYISTSLQNDSDWRVPAYDDLCKRAMSEPDEKKRIGLLSAAENMIDTQVPIIPLYHYVNIGMNPDWVHGVDPNPRGVTIFKGIWIDQDQRAREGGRR